MKLQIRYYSSLLMNIPLLSGARLLQDNRVIKNAYLLAFRAKSYQMFLGFFAM